MLKRETGPSDGPGRSEPFLDQVRGMGSEQEAQSVLRGVPWENLSGPNGEDDSIEVRKAVGTQHFQRSGHDCDDRTMMTGRGRCGKGATDAHRSASVPR